MVLKRKRKKKYKVYQNIKEHSIIQLMLFELVISFRLSICHKGLILESGIEVVLPLMPGSCGDNITDVSVGNSSLNVSIE